MTGKSSQSLQDILKKRQSSDVVGRDAQINDFRANLMMEPDDERRRFIFNIFGQGGIGKTTLVRQFRQIAHSSDALTAYMDEGVENEVELMGKIAEQFKEQDHQLSLFEERYHVYQQRKQELESDPEIPQGGAVFVSHLVTKVGLRLSKLTPLAPFVDLIDEDTAAAQVSEWTKYVISKLNNKDEVQLVLKPIEILTPLFLRDLNTIALKHQLVIFLDTYEHTGQFLDEWLRSTLDGNFGFVPNRILITIAGRSELDRNLWSSFSPLVARIELNPFTKQEAEDFLSRKGITNQSVIDVIIRLSGGLPLLVATLASQSPNSSQDVEDPTSTAVERFLKWVDDPALRRLALNTALSRHINKDVISQIAIGQNADELFSWLKGMPFVEQRGGYWTYHPVVRESMLRHKHHESKDDWGDLHDKLAAYYEKKLSELGLIEQEKTKNTDWQNLSLDFLYHRLCCNSTKYLPFALNGFLKAMDSKLSFARHWANTIKQAGDDSSISELQDWGNSLLECLTAYDDNRYKDAELIFSKLLDIPDIDNELRAIALGWRANINYFMNNYEEALEDFDKAININPHYSWAFARRGETYRVMDKRENALSDLSKAIELNHRDDYALSSRGALYEVLEQFDDALSDYSEAIELNSNYIWALDQRQKLYRSLKRYKESLVDVEKIIELKPNDLNWEITRLEILFIENRQKDILACIERLEKRIPEFANRIKDDFERDVTIYKNELQKPDVDTETKALNEFLVDFGQGLVSIIASDPSTVTEIGHIMMQLIKAQAQANLGKFDDGLETLDHNNIWSKTAKCLPLLAKIISPDKLIEALNPGTITLREVADYRKLIYRIVGLINNTKKQVEPLLHATWCLYQAYQYGINDQLEASLQAAEKVDGEITESIIWLARASLYQDLGKYEAAITDFSHAIELDPESNWAFSLRGQAFVKIEKYDEALSDYHEAIAKDEQKDIILVERAEIYQTIEQYDKALIDLSKAISIDPKYTSAFIKKGSVYDDMGSYSDAITALNQAIETNPKSNYAYTLRGYIYHKLARYDDALNDFNQSLKINPRYSWSLARRAVTSISLLKHEDALNDFNQAIDIDKDYVWAINQRGKLHRDTQKYENAINDFTHSTQIMPNSNWSYYQLSLVYYITNQKEKGDDTLLTAIKLLQAKLEKSAANRKSNSCNLALAYLALGDYQESDTKYQEILSIDISPDLIQECVDDINELIRFLPSHQALTILDLLKKKKLLLM